MQQRGSLLLRQVLCNHGHCVPPFRMGSMREWLPLLPEPELTSAMDRCTVLSPRPGDGFYAPPPGSNEDGDAGFPWGELTSRGVERMKRAGRRHLCSPSAVAACAKLDRAGILVRAVNRPRSIASAQAAVLGACEAAAATSPSPVEILLQGGEDLLPSATVPLGSMEEAEQELDRAALPAEDVQALCDAGRRGAEMGIADWDRLLEAALCLEDADVPASITFSAGERTALRRLAVARRTAGLQPVGARALAAVCEVIGPLLRELLRACDAALEGRLDAGVVFYASQADALACTVAALNLRASGGQDLSAGPPCSWPAFGEALEVALIDEGGEPCLCFAYEGQAVLPIGGLLGTTSASNSGDTNGPRALPLAIVKDFFADVLRDDTQPSED